MKEKVIARKSGVIWITGYSASGKTTVGRKVENLVRDRGGLVIFLDGDDLRSIFAGKWGYERDQREELAHVYFRLASHLASQGATVVISAVAMYADVRTWVKENIPNSLQAYLEVPERERIDRDSKTKDIYGNFGDISAMYDEPTDDVLRVNNFGDVTPDYAAGRILEAYDCLGNDSGDFGRKVHWGSYYATDVVPTSPSPFAEYVMSQIEPHSRLLEIGCGNGRDSAFFTHQGHDVTAIDRSTAAIESCMAKGFGARFIAGTVIDFPEDNVDPFDLIYSRFVLHAMPLKEEEDLLDGAVKLLTPQGRIFVECRSINDPLARLGEVLSPTERIYGHYRRFIVLDELIERLTARGLRIEECIESDDLAVYKDENPVVIRIVARKG